MKMAKVLGAMVCCLAMAACGSKEEASVNGMKAGDYYNQFVTEKSTQTCDGKSHTDNSATGMVGGQDITLKMTGDGKFQILSGWSSNEVWSGSWSVDKTELVLNQISRGSGVIWNKQTAISMDFSYDARVPSLLRGQKTTLIRNWSTYTCQQTQ